MKTDTIIVFTDGSSRGNPGPGGWGTVVIDALGKVTELGGREDHTTNNRMELAAACAGLTFIEKRKVEGKTIEIHADSAYVLQGITGWVYGWEKNGWKTKTGDDVLNQDLWKELGALVFRLKQKYALEWKKVSGHTGLLGNERADLIATNAADKTQQLLYVGPLSEYEKLIGGSVFEGTDETLVSQKKKKSSKKTGPPYSYVSLVDGTAATHKTWAECEARAKGKKGARFQKVFSKDEESSLIEQWTRGASKKTH